MEGDLEFGQFGLQMFGLLELQPNHLKSKLATPTIIHHLNAIFLSTPPSPFEGWGGAVPKRIALNVELCFTIIPFYLFHC